MASAQGFLSRHAPSRYWRQLALLCVFVLLLTLASRLLEPTSSRPQAPLPSSAAAAPIATVDAGGLAAVDVTQAADTDPGAPDQQVILVSPENWDDQSRANVDEALALLPAAVRAQLGNPILGPLMIEVTRDGITLSGHQPYGGPANFYSTNDARNEVVLYPDQGVQVVLHELGHAYNLRHVEAGAYARVLLEPEMQSFVAASGWQVLTPLDQLRRLTDQAQVQYAYDGPQIWTNLSHNDPLEDFANSFALYFADPGQLQQLSPARYDWFQARFGAAPDSP